MGIWCNLAASTALAVVILVFGKGVERHAFAQETGQLIHGMNWTGDFDGMEKRRAIRVLVPYSKTIYFIDKGEQLGTAVELGNALEKWVNRGRKREIDKIRVAFIPVPRSELIPALNAGRGDIISSDMTITPEREAEVDFSDPFATGVHEVLVTGPNSPVIKSLDKLGNDAIYVRKSSSYYEHLISLNHDRLATGKPVLNLLPADENLEDEDILELINAGILPLTVVDRFKAKIWSDVFTKLVVRDDIAISNNGSIAWAFRKNSPQLAKELSAFLKEHKIGTAFGNTLRKKYYQNDRIIREAYSPGEIAKFQSLWVHFQSYAATYNFDPVLLAAQGYQESQLDQRRRSPRGAVGIMQLLPSTAESKEIGVHGIAESPERNIEAGAKYMRLLSDVYVKDPSALPLDNMLLALASYNAGPGNLRKFRTTTQDMGLNPHVWFGNVEQGAAKIVGRETVQYVSNIYKYYVAYSLYLDQRISRQDALTRASEIPSQLTNAIGSTPAAEQ